MKDNASSLKELQIIPGVGPSIAEDLQILGIYSVSDLNGKKPEVMYRQLCIEMGQKLDKFSLAVLLYFYNFAFINDSFICSNSI